MSRLRNTDDSYGWVAKLLHWLMAPLVVGLFALGYWMRTLSYYDPWYQRAPELHKSIGIMLMVLIGCRLLWRLINEQPLALSDNKLERLAGQATHLAFYALLIAMAMSGYLFGTGDGKPIVVFDLFEIPSLVKSKPMADFVGDLHKWMAYSFMGLLVLHVSAALKHHFFDKDDTLRRMLRARK